MTELLTVMLGGALGAGIRLLVGNALTARLGNAFPWGTLTINLIGGLLMGLLAGWLTRGGDEGARLFLGVGILGGFTTFSAFSLDFVVLVQRGEPLTAITYAAAAVIGSIALCALGIAATRAA